MSWGQSTPTQYLRGNTKLFMSRKNVLINHRIVNHTWMCTNDNPISYVRAEASYLWNIYEPISSAFLLLQMLLFPQGVISYENQE